MSSKINVQSIDALPRLRMALGRFSESVRESAADAERIVARNIDRLDDACYQLEREMRRREDDYDCADPEDDDMSYLAYMRDKARDNFEQAVRTRRMAAETGRDLSNCIRRVQEVAGSRLAEAQTLLGQKIIELRNYTGVQPAGYSGGAGLSSAAISSKGADLVKDANSTLHVETVLNYILTIGRPPNGYIGGKNFHNDSQRGQELPRMNAGLPVTYKEYDVYPSVRGINRGKERLVIGSDGSAHYTADHYDTFVQLR